VVWHARGPRFDSRRNRSFFPIVHGVRGALSFVRQLSSYFNRVATSGVIVKKSEKWELITKESLTPVFMNKNSRSQVRLKHILANQMFGIDASVQLESQ
jgi:hypothetical protein